MEVLILQESKNPKARFEMFKSIKLPSFLKSHEEFVDMVNRSGCFKIQITSIEDIPQNEIFDQWLPIWMETIDIPIKDLQRAQWKIDIFQIVMDAKRTIFFLVHQLLRLKVDPSAQFTREDCAAFLSTPVSKEDIDELLNE